MPQLRQYAGTLAVIAGQKIGICSEKLVNIENNA